MDKRLKTQIWWMVAALLLAAGVRLYALDAQSIWFDEGWSAHAAMQPTLIDAANADATNPPLYYTLVHVGARFFGTSEFGLRFVSVVFGLLALAVTYRLGHAIGGRQTAMGALWTAALMGALWWGSQEARMYTLLALLIAAAAWAWHRLLLRPTRAAWIILWATELALLYAHNTAPAVALWLNIATLIVWITARSVKKPDWRTWIGGQCLVGLLWLPYFVSRFLNLTDANSAITTAPSLTPDFLAQIGSAFWIMPWERVARGGVAAWEGLLIGLIGAALLVSLRSRSGRWMLLHAALLIAGMLLGLFILGNDFHGRYIVMAAPLVAVALGSLRPRLLMVFAVAICGALLIASIAARPTFPNDNVRGAVLEYAQRLTSTDTVLMWSYADRYELAYYWDRFDVSVQRVTLPEGADMAAILPLLPEPGGDVALNVWYTQRADYRGMMNCLLSAGTAPPEAFQVDGMDSQIYRAPPLIPPALEPLDVWFGDGSVRLAHLDSVGQPPPTRADHAACIPLHLSALDAPETEMKALIVVRDGRGREIARVDAVFADAAQRTIGVFERSAAFATIRLPAGTPPGTYDLFVRLYDEKNHLSGLIPEDTQRTRFGRDLWIGTWEIVPGAVWMPDSHTDAPLTLIETQPVSITVNNGTAFDLTLLWSGRGALPDLTLTLPDGTAQAVPTEIAQHDDLTREMRTIRIPAEMMSGTAAIALPDGEIITSIQVEALPMLLDAPAFANEVDVEFPGVGRLVGFTYSPENLEAQLVWQAEAAAAISYTVFVQLIDADGRVVAQSDSAPARGSRPTTGWRAGEFIEDRHTLRVNPGFSADQMVGARLIAGMYDPATGARLQMGDSTDYAVLSP
jgi:hypothetical protein